jgi:hypothetical protein
MIFLNAKGARFKQGALSFTDESINVFNHLGTKLLINDCQ